MQRTSFGWSAVASLGIVVLVGCAVGSDPGNGESDLTNLPVEAGEGDENSVPLPPSSSPAEDAATTSDAGDDRSDAAPSVDGGSDSGVVVVPTGCASSSTCTGATDLGTVSGDTGTSLKTAQGSTSQWFSIRVTEDDSSLIGLSLLFKAELTSPPAANFDLFVYVAGSGTGQECSAITASSTSASIDVAKAEWGESGGFSNGSSDDRTVTVEVRHVSGTCSPTAKWSLAISGNAP